MKNVFHPLVCALVVSVAVPLNVTAQAPKDAPKSNAPRVEFPAPSPASTLTQRVGLTDIEVKYSRPGVKGRKIFGEKEPYGKVWRTGANAATQIKFSTPVKFGGIEVPAGSYALFSIPEANEWTVILNKNVEQWGAFTHKESDDVARVKAKPVKLAEPVETFTIDINDIRNDSATLNLIWTDVRVPVKLEFDTVKNVTAQIEEAMAPGKTPPQGLRGRAAAFYIEQGVELQKAVKWLDEELAAQPNRFNTHYQKARALAKLGDKKGAIESAKKSLELLANEKNAGVKAEYTRLNEEIIESAGK